MPFVRIWVHLVWSTKNRVPMFKREIRDQVLHHIRDNAREKQIYLDTINAVDDHVHALVSLGGDQTISGVTQLLKGESSHWINLRELTPLRFEWQDEYFAVSVSESMVETVRQYIGNQEEHHRKKSFGVEYEELVEKYGFEIVRKSRQ